MDDRFARQIKLLGEEGQRRLAGARVLVAGAGGLGSSLLYALAAAGVGHIIIADGDVLSPSNLNRQILYTEADLGKNKALCAARRLQALNGDVEYIPVCENIRDNNGKALLEGCSAAALCLDSREARLMMNRLCCRQGIMLADAGVEGLGGYVTAVRPGETPCLECWFGKRKTAASAPQTLGAAAAAIASMEALALLQLLLGQAGLAGQMLIFDGAHWSWEKITGQRQPDCSACGISTTVR